MKMKRLFTLAALLTSSLAGVVEVGAVETDAVETDAVDLEDKYYVGLNFGGGYSGGLSLKPSILLGYHYQENFKLELEINSNIQSLKSIGASLLANYRYYPDIDIDPVTLYVSGGLGGYVQIIGEASWGKKSLTSSGGGVQDKFENPIEESKNDEDTKKNSTSSGGEDLEKNKGDVSAGEDSISSGGDKDKTGTPIEKNKGDGTPEKDSTDSGSHEDKTPKEEKEVLKPGTGRKPPNAPNAETGEVVADRYSNEAISDPVMYANEAISDQSLANKILDHIAYRLKIGVDYKFTPWIIGAVGFNVGGSLYNLLQLQVGTGIELGIRYNF